MHIGAADAGVSDADEDGVGVCGEGGDRPVFERDGVGRLEDKGEVLSTMMSVSGSRERMGGVRVGRPKNVRFWWSHLHH